MRRITIVGAGRVGETTAQILAEKDLCREIALLDVREDVPQGVALDICQTAPGCGPGHLPDRPLLRVRL